MTATFWSAARLRRFSGAANPARSATRARRFAVDLHRRKQFDLTDASHSISSRLVGTRSFAHMKKFLAASMLIALSMIWSCQKQDSTADQQLTQRKTELDAREKALNERERALRERERAVAIGRVIPPDAQSSRAARDVAQMQAERDKKLQQLPIELRALIPPPGQMHSARIDTSNEATQRPAQSPATNLQQLQAERERKLQQLPPELRALIPPPSRLRSSATGPSPTPGESPSPSPSPPP